MPGAVESFSGSLDGDVDIGFGGLLDRADDLLITGRPSAHIVAHGSITVVEYERGIDDLEGLALDTLDELVVDEPVRSSGQRACSMPIRSKGRERGRRRQGKTHSPKGWSYFIPLGSSMCKVVAAAMIA